MNNFHGETKLAIRYQEMTEDIHKTYSKAVRYCLAGTHGTGKTTVLCNVIKHAVLKGFTCLYTSLSDIATVSTSTDYEDRYIAMRELKLVDFLIIDEVDDRFVNQSEQSNEFFSRLFEITIRTRMQNSLPILLASNSPNLKEIFAGHFKGSLGSLMEQFSTTSVFGNDYRKTKKIL